MTLTSTPRQGLLEFCGPELDQGPSRRRRRQPALGGGGGPLWAVGPRRRLAWAMLAHPRLGGAGGCRAAAVRLVAVGHSGSGGGKTARAAGTRHKSISGATLLNADGSLVMACHPKKAAWYLQQGLADQGPR
jgi:hypothetical protein